MNIGTTLKTWAKRIKRDGVTLWFAGKHPRTPWYAKALGLFVVAYALSPIDLIPDFIPVLGYVDDVILLPVLIWLTVKGSAHETEKIVRYALSCQSSTMIDMPRRCSLNTSFSSPGAARKLLHVLAEGLRRELQSFDHRQVGE